MVPNPDTNTHDIPAYGRIMVELISSDVEGEVHSGTKSANHPILKPFQSQLEVMNRRDANYEAFLKHWKSLRSEGELLTTSEAYLDSPNPLFAANTLILDVYPDDIIIRLQATELVERWGKDLTGHSMFDAPLPMQRQDMMTNVGRLLRQPCGLLSVNKTRTSGGRSLLVETFGIPLGVAPGRPTRMLNYSWLSDPVTEGEHSEAVAAYEKQEWIDIGAGVPNERPLKPMIPS
jgi:hypothetical protein